MNKFLNLLLMPLVAVSFNAGAAQGNDFPTHEIVRYALDCMADKGGLSDETFYYCTCRFDAMASQISFSDYDEGVTFERNKNMAGKRGGFFRDSERGKQMFDKLQEARKHAESQCILVKKVTR
jgi:hypothetical protein